MIWQKKLFNLMNCSWGNGWPIRSSSNPLRTPNVRVFGFIPGTCPSLFIFPGFLPYFWIFSDSLTWFFFFVSSIKSLIKSLEFLGLRDFRCLFLNYKIFQIYKKSNKINRKKFTIRFFRCFLLIQRDSRYRLSKS